MRALLEPLGWIVAMLIVALGCAATNLALKGAGDVGASGAGAILSGVAAVFQAIFAGIALLSLRFNRIASEAATDALEHQRDTTKQQLRAYLGSSGCVIDKAALGAPLILKCTFKNAGATPARHVSMTFETRLRWVGKRDVSAKTVVGPVMLPDILPGDDMEIIAQPTKRLTPEERDGIRDRTREAWVQVDVDYEDIFGQRHTASGEWAHFGPLAKGTQLSVVPVGGRAIHISNVIT